jgi:hypothetical protein
MEQTVFGVGYDELFLYLADKRATGCHQSLAQMLARIFQDALYSR